MNARLSKTKMLLSDFQLSLSVVDFRGVERRTMIQRAVEDMKWWENCSTVALPGAVPGRRRGQLGNNERKDLGMENMTEMDSFVLLQINGARH